MPFRHGLDIWRRDASRDAASCALISHSVRSFVRSCVYWYIIKTRKPHHAADYAIALGWLFNDEYKHTHTEWTGRDGLDILYAARWRSPQHHCAKTIILSFNLKSESHGNMTDKHEQNERRVAFTVLCVTAVQSLFIRQNNNNNNNKKWDRNRKTAVDRMKPRNRMIGRFWIFHFHIFVLAWRLLLLRVLCMSWVCRVYVSYFAANKKIEINSRIPLRKKGGRTTNAKWGHAEEVWMASRL